MKMWLRFQLNERIVCAHKMNVCDSYQLVMILRPLWLQRNSVCLSVYVCMCVGREVREEVCRYR